MWLKRISAAKHGRESVFYWFPSDKRFYFFQNINVGDRLALDLVGRVIGERGLGFADYSGGARKLFSVGSVLRLARSGDVVWGTGINGKTLDRWGPVSGLDLRAVRGPLTAKKLGEMGMDAPTVYGDPGILADRFFPLRLTAELPYWVVPHFRESADLYPGQPLLSPKQMPGKFLKKLVQARLVVSSSLHGLVLAEAYGIPAVPLKNRSGEHVFKYQDYYEGTGREFPGFSETVEEALRREPPPGIPPGVKDRLMAAFPWDVWGRHSVKDAPKQAELDKRR